MPNGRLMEEAGIQAVIKGLGEFKSGAGEMDRAIQGIGDSAGEAQKPVSGLKAHLDHMAESAGSAAIAFGGLAAAGTALIAKTVMLAARNEELDIVMETVGKTAGITMERLKEEEERIKKLGITTQEARGSLILFMQGQLDISDAAKLARTAQDLAVVGMKDSSAAYRDLTESILSQQVLRLREYGITLTLTQIYEQYAKEVLNAGAAVTRTTVDNSGDMAMLGREMALLQDKIKLNNEELALQIGYWGEDDVRVKKHRQSIEGMNIQLAKMSERYNKLAGDQGRVIETKKELSKELTDEQKKQAFLYAILQEGEKVAGVYEAAMSKVGKQIRSLPRYFEELAFAIGEYFLEPLGIGVTLLTDFLKYVTALPPEMKKTIASFVMVGTASSGAVAGLAGMFKMAPLLAGALSFLISPLGLLAAAVGALAGAFVMDIGGIRTKVMPTLEAIGSVLKDKVAVGIETAMKVLQPLIAGIRDLLSGNIENVLLDFGAAVGRAFGIEKGLEFYQFLKDVQARIQEVVDQVRPYVEEFTVWFGENIILALMNLQAIWNEVWPQIQQVVSSVIGGVVETIGTAWTTIREWTEKNWPTIQATIQAVLEWIGSFVDLTIKNVVAIITSAWTIIRKWTDQNWPLIQKTIETILTVIMNIVSWICAAIKAFWDRWGQGLLSLAQTVWNMIKVAIETIINVILGIIKTVMLLINRDWSGAWEEIKKIGETLWEGIKTIISLAIEKVRDIIESVMNYLTENWPIWWEAIKVKVGEIWDGIKTKIGEVIESIKIAIGTWLGDIKQTIIDYKDKMVEAGKQLMNGLLEGMKEMKDKIINWILGLLRGMKKAIKEFFGFTCPEPSRLMMQYGRQVMEGFIKGLEQMRPALESQLQMTLAPAMQVAAPATVGGRGGTTIYNYQYQVGPLTANYAQVQSPASIMDDLRALEMLAGARG